MIYELPSNSDSVDQGDLIDDCPIVKVSEFDPGDLNSARVHLDVQRVYILTQTCDFVNEKTTNANVACVFDAAKLVAEKILKPADIKGPLRAGRVWGYYFLPADKALGFGEMIVDLRRLHTISLQLLSQLCHAGKRITRLRTPYREHLSKHFADTFSRIGLPSPYDTK